VANDIVTRLRVKDGVYTEFWQQKLMDEAADEIDRLRAEVDLKGGRLDDALDEIEQLRGIAEELADAFQKVTDHGDACPICWESFRATWKFENCFGHAAVIELEARRG